MKPYLIELVRSAPDPLAARHLVREYLQARILASLQRAGAFVPLAFHGGTALRFLYQIGRYSEDLDFSLERDPQHYDFRGYLATIRSDFEAEGYQVEMKTSMAERAVHSAFVRFRGLLYELGLSPHGSETLSVKLEVDTRPPAGAGLETTLVRRYILLHLQHHDRASLLAGKLHALLQRDFTKGRDLYDLLWYLSDPGWPAPNLAMLNHALRQTGWQGEPLNERNWRDVVRHRLAALDWQKAVEDVRPFLMTPSEAALLTLENLTDLLG